MENVLALLQPNDFMAVIDIKSAYRAVSIHPEDKKYMGLRWDIQGKEVFIEDSRLCFGLSLGPMVFNSISNFVYSILTDVYNLQAVNYLDDFLVLGHTKEEAQFAQNIVIKTLRYLGFYISWAKVTPPSKVCRYLGLDIDSIEIELRLPNDKLEKLIFSVNKFKDKSSISKQELESLGGLLSHCSHVLDGGRTHSRRFYDLYKIILNNNLKRIKLGLAAKEDLKWWANFSKTFNGKKKIIYPEYELPLVSDSSLKGFAIYKGEEWLAGSGDDSLILDNDKCNHIISSPSFDNYNKTNINELELWPIISGLRVLYPDLKGKSVSIFTDNTQVYHMICKGTSSNKTCMQWLREFFWICKIYLIMLVPYYINTKNNLVADTLSRILYIKGESEAKKCLNGTDLCCSQIFLTIAENLEKRAESLRKNSVSRSTLKTREKQWACYEKNCKQIGWKFFSCDSSQACKYLAYLSNIMKYSSVINYYQTVIFFHKVKGHTVAGWSDILVSQTVKGIKNSQKIPDDVKDPLTLKNLQKMYRNANKKTHMGLMVWTMIVFLFSTLLRVSHVSNTFLLRITCPQKKGGGEGVQMTCKNANVINGRPQTTIYT